MHKAKKSLGQNFLKSAVALKKIIEAGEISSEDIVLEVGPGKGVLTEKILEHAGRVIAVEKDRDLFNFLKDKFKKEIEMRTLILVCEDILNFDTSAYGLKPSAYKIISNIPYNITGALLKKFLSGENQPERMVLMVQNEVAKRIVDEKGSLLSISVKAYGQPKRVMKVEARYFSPVPKVDSAVVEIKNISKRIFTENSIKEEKFWQIVRAGFAHKRKKLSGNLKNVVPEDILAPFLNKRAEDLTLSDWITLAK